MQTTLWGANCVTGFHGRSPDVLSRRQLHKFLVSPPSTRRTRIKGSLRASQATRQTQAQATPRLKLTIAAHEIPHPAKLEYGGEDAFFISEQGSTAFGVADGVGGWANSGINPAEYSKTLMREAKAHFESFEEDSSGDSAESTSSSSPATTKSEKQTSQQTSSNSSSPSSSNSSNASPSTSAASNSSTRQSDQQVGSAASTSSSQLECNPQTALAAAHEATRQPGSSTALILQLKDGTNTLKASNLGDSGFAVFRKGKVIAQSNPLQHFFDCPYQFAACPDFTEDTDKPEDASSYELQLESGDVVVAATDGLWDNLHLEELIPLLPTSEDDVKQAASKIAEAASSNAFDDEYSSPYTDEAKKQGMDLPWWQKVSGAKFKDGKVQLARLQGGKVDDITVVVAYATAP